MGALDFIAGLAEIILALILLIATLLVAALCGGLWFGLRFTERKSGPALDKVNEYVGKARRFEKTGLGYAVKPVIAANSAGEAAGNAITALVRKAHEGKERQT